MRFSSIRYKCLSRLLGALALLISAVVVNASQKPTSAELAAITDRGRLLAEYDAAAWHATDAVLDAHPKGGKPNIADTGGNLTPVQACWGHHINPSRIVGRLPW